MNSKTLEKFSLYAQGRQLVKQGFTADRVKRFSKIYKACIESIPLFIHILVDASLKGE
jgi:hypothetical protein